VANAIIALSRPSISISTPVRTERGRDHVVEAHGGRPEHSGGVQEHLLRLRDAAARRQLAGRWILTDLPLKYKKPSTAFSLPLE
jgi:hypothetical protein